MRALFYILITVFFLTATTQLYARTEKATFAGGCFWCIEPPFEALAGVLSVTSGYTGGNKTNPTYEEVSAGGTGHAESIEIIYDPSVIPYQKLLDVFWHNIDPTASNRQFCDTGSQYRSVIFYNSEEQARIARSSKDALEKCKPFRQTIITQITAGGPFYKAEEYHQNYYKKKPIQYKYYRYRCGRDKRLNDLWGEQAGH